MTKEKINPNKENQDSNSESIKPEPTKMIDNNIQKGSESFEADSESGIDSEGNREKRIINPEVYAKNYNLKSSHLSNGANKI